MPRLKRSDVSSPGYTRRGRGKGFEYLDAGGERIDDPETLARVRDLVIPPAWRDVWISPEPRGHIQATGFDAAGRKQYRYHDDWRSRRDAQKFDSMTGFARALPALRDRVASDLAASGELTEPRVLACATRLLDRGFFRVGSEGYAEENETYGLATIRKDHVEIDGDVMVFDYTAKSKKRRIQRVDDEDIVPIVATLKRRRGGGPELLAFKRGRSWVDVKSDDINTYVKAASDGDFTAKDFRTWNATVLAAIALAVSPPTDLSKTARQRAKARAVKEVARYLGNTPAVCRASYIDPRVFDRYDGGMTVGGVLPALVDEDGGWPVIQPQIDAGVVDLLEERTESDAVVEA